MNAADSTNQPPDRLTAWVQAHGSVVLGFLVGVVRDRHLAEDLLQEVFCRAWMARHRYADTGRERAYLLRIADRVACDRLRRGGRETPLYRDEGLRIEPADEDSGPWQLLVAAECDRALAAALDSLSEPQRRVLLLRYYGNLEFREIAELLQCPLNTALSHAHRGLAALKRQLVEETS